MAETGTDEERRIASTSSRILGGTKLARSTGYSQPQKLPSLVVGLAVPVQLSGRILVYGQNFQFQYMLPDNATFFTNFFEGSSRRRRRNVSWNERAPVYNVLEQELDRRNIDGKSCLKKNICEAAATPLKDEGLLGELLHLLLTPDHGDASTMDEEYLEAAAAGRRGKNCSSLYSSCPVGAGILDKISIVY
nr:PREDICTED: uncharacterized protein LOC100881561 [Megachile rotundata]